MYSITGSTPAWFYAGSTLLEVAIRDELVRTQGDLQAAESLKAYVSGWPFSANNTIYVKVGRKRWLMFRKQMSR